MAKVNKDALKAEEHATLYLLKGTLDALDLDVPAGPPIKVGNREVTFTIPEAASVTRALGTLGDGFDSTPPKELTLSPMAERIFLDKLLAWAETDGEWSGFDVDQHWLDSIREAERGTKIEPCEEALAALAKVVAELPAAEPGKRRTPGKRSGEKEVTIAVKRLTKKAVKTT